MRAGRSLLAALVVLAAALGPARALEPLGARGLAVVNGGGGEFFMTPVPIDWKIVQSRMGERVLNMSWLPEGQSARDWSDKVTLMVFPGQTGMTGRELLSQLAQRYANDCAELQNTQTQVKQTRGHTVAFRFLGCTDYRDSGRGQLVLFRTVEGARSFYLVQRAWRTPSYAVDTLPFHRELLGKTRLWLQGGRLCQADSADPERACPPRLADAIARTSLEKPVTVLRLGEAGDGGPDGPAD